MANPMRHRVWISLAMAVVFVLGVVATQSAKAQTFTVLHSFTGGHDGGVPYAQPVVDRNGNIFGTTTKGVPVAINPGCGTLWELTKSGKCLPLEG